MSSRFDFIDGLRRNTNKITVEEKDSVRQQVKKRKTDYEFEVIRVSLSNLVSLVFIKEKLFEEIKATVHLIRRQ